MSPAAWYLVAVLHAREATAGTPDRPDTRLEPVHLFVLPADTVQARLAQHDNHLETAAGLAFELATADPAWLPPPWAGLARRYRADGLRPFGRGDVMVVLPPGGSTAVLLYASHGWEHLGPATGGPSAVLAGWAAETPGRDAERRPGC